MLPVTKNIAIYQGDTYALSIRLRAKNTLGVTEDIDLTGATLSSQIRNKETGELIVPFTVEIVSATTGEAKLKLSSTQTTALTTGGRYDLQVEYPDGTVRTYLKGSVSLTKQVTP